MNVSPNKEGLIHDNDVKRIKQFGEGINSIFKKNLVLNSKVTSSSVLNDSRNLDIPLINNVAVYKQPKELEVEKLLKK